MERLLISFSGGETSAFMTQWLMQYASHSEKVIVFANTGQENEQTLDFVQRCSLHFGWPVVWVEAKVNPHKGKGTEHNVVTYETASRDGLPFEEVIRKYGIPNQAFPHCTRELKLQPIKSYVRSLGWKPGSYQTAIGIRADEGDRMSPSFRESNLWYPLVSAKPMTKPDVNAYWRDMPFRLELKGYEGNCKWCWKKSLRKHLTIIRNHPEWYDFPERMEAQYPKEINGKCVSFFRQNRSVKDLKQMASRIVILPAADDSVIYDGLQYDLDIFNDCSESCELNFDGDFQ